MTAIVWIHADCLRRECAAFQQYPTAPAVFVWDDVVLRGYGLSLKRMVFLYECLLDLDVAIYRGDVAAQVRAIAVLHDAHRVVTMATEAPRFGTIVADLRTTHTVEVLADEPFVDTPADLDIARFSRYWSRVRGDVLRKPTQRGLFDEV